MKKIYKKNAIRLALMMMMAYLLVGCGNSNAEVDNNPVENVPETTVEDQTVTEVVEETKESEQVDKEETTVEEQQQEEVSTEKTEAQVTTTVDNFDGLVAYILSLEDTTTPHIVIYNEAEGYIIDMKEGEHYQLKKDDRIFINVGDENKYCSYSIPKTSYNPIAGGRELIPDYSKFEAGEHHYDIYLTEDFNEYNELTCYLDPPIE